MPRTIDYLFSLMSPWAYLGFERFHEIARRHEVRIRYRPALLGEIFAETGGLPLARRHPVRQAYRLVELQRWRAARGLPLALKPRFWPFEGALADQLAVAVIAAGHAPEAYLRAAHRAIWAEERDLADERELAALLAASGLPADLLVPARSPKITDLYAANRDWAVAAGVFGAPSYVLDGEVFWGQDRLDLLDAALASGRPAYGPDTDF